MGIRQERGALPTYRMCGDAVSCWRLWHGWGPGSCDQGTGACQRGTGHAQAPRHLPRGPNLGRETGNGIHRHWKWGSPREAAGVLGEQCHCSGWSQDQGASSGAQEGSRVQHKEGQSPAVAGSLIIPAIGHLTSCVASRWGAGRATVPVSVLSKPAAGWSPAPPLQGRFSMFFRQNGNHSTRTRKVPAPQSYGALMTGC